MSYKWRIRLRPFKHVFSEGANFAIFSTDLKALLVVGRLQPFTLHETISGITYTHPQQNLLL